MKQLRGSEINQKEIGDDFYGAYKRCFEGKNQHQNQYGIIVSGIVAIPGFVNGLFACEIYFKYLLGDRVSKITGKDRHNLKVLFDNLDEEFKEELYSITCKKEYTLDKLLFEIGEGFMKWRYIYEDGNETFGNNFPFCYTKYFLETFLPVINRIATKKYEGK